MDYAKYLEVYNSGDRLELVRRFCTEDVVFEAGARKEIHRGKHDVARFLLGLQKTFREVIRPQVVLRSDDHVFVEADVDLYAESDLLDHPFGPLKKGESFTMKAFAVYYLRGGKICRFKTALWPPNFGVTAASDSRA
jgi:SnoaL-like protein